MQSETAGFAPVPPPANKTKQCCLTDAPHGELDQIYASSLILAHALHYWKHDVIHKTGSTQHIALTDTANMYRKFCVIWTYGFTTRRCASKVCAVVLCPSVRLSSCPYVCLNFISRYSSKTTKRRITQITPHSSFRTPKILVKFEWRHPRRWRQIQVV